MRKYLYASRTTGLSGNRVATWAIDPDGTTAGDALGWAFTSFGTVDVPDLSVETTPSDSDFRTQWQMAANYGWQPGPTL
jgi:hypothetical protein